MSANPLVLRLEADLRLRLEALAKEQQATLSEAVRKLLWEGLRRHAGAGVDAFPEAQGIVARLTRLASDMARLQGITEEHARAVFGMEQLLCYWASRSSHEASEEVLLEELREVGKEELWRVLSRWLGPETLEVE